MNKSSQWSERNSNPLIRAELRSSPTCWPLGHAASLPRTLRSDDGDLHENIVEKSFNFLSIILSRPDTEKKGIYVGAEGRGPPPSSDGDARIYGLAVPVLKWT